MSGPQAPPSSAQGCGVHTALPSPSRGSRGLSQGCRSPSLPALTPFHGPSSQRPAPSPTCSVPWVSELPPVLSDLHTQVMVVPLLQTLVHSHHLRDSPLLALLTSLRKIFAGDQSCFPPKPPTCRFHKAVLAPCLLAPLLTEGVTFPRATTVAVL